MPRSEAANERIRQEQRAKILDAARMVFARKGEAATMADVAAEANVSQGLAYRYFANKEAIFCELIEQAARSGGAGQRVLETPGTPGERLTMLLSRIVAALREPPGFYQLLNQVVRDETTPDDLRELLRGMYRRLRRRGPGHRGGRCGRSRPAGDRRERVPGRFRPIGGKRP